MSIRSIVRILMLAAVALYIASPLDFLPGELDDAVIAILGALLNVPLRKKD